MQPEHQSQTGDRTQTLGFLFWTKDARLGPDSSGRNQVSVALPLTSQPHSRTGKVKFNFNPDPCVPTAWVETWYPCGSYVCEFRGAAQRLPTGGGRNRATVSRSQPQALESLAVAASCQKDAQASPSLTQEPRCEVTGGSWKPHAVHVGCPEAEKWPRLHEGPRG